MLGTFCCGGFIYFREGSAAAGGGERDRGGEKGKGEPGGTGPGARLPREELALPLLIIRSARKSQARLERRGKGGQCTLPEVRLPHSS